MPRARNIKPSFFDDDLLAEVEPLGRLFFIGLWTIADYKGEFEWREKRVKTKILPYDNCDIKKIAINLDKSGFIRFYSDGEKIYCKVVNFVKHQNPHKNEKLKGSDVPEYSEKMRQVVDLKELTINRDKIETNPDKNGSAPADSCFLIPDSLINNPDSDRDEEFESVWEMYEKKGNKKTSRLRFNKLTRNQKLLLFDHLPKYVESTPDLKFRKDFERYISKECWNDKIVTPIQPSSVNGISKSVEEKFRAAN